jgi:hypothetical protein
MSLLYLNRTVQLRIGPPGGGPAGQFGREWSIPKIEFDIERNLGKEPNTCSISLWNPDPVSVGVITAAGATVQLLAGYQAIPTLLFSGDIPKRGVTIEQSRTDRVVTVEAGDGELPYKTARFDWHFVAGTDNNTILSAILVSMGLGLGPGSPTLPPKVYNSDVTFFGPAREALNEIVTDVGATWSIQDGNVVILLTDEQTTAEQAAFLTPGTGLIGSPTRTDEGINVQSLLNGLIRPGKLLSVVSRSIIGFFKAVKVRHSGDNWTGDFFTETEAIPLGIS